MKWGKDCIRYMDLGKHWHIRCSQRGYILCHVDEASQDIDAYCHFDTMQDALSYFKEATK